MVDDTGCPETMESVLTGDENLTFRDYFCAAYLSGRRDLRGLTLGCGEGQKVLHWARIGLFKRIDAYDLSPERLEKARCMAQEAGLQHCIDGRTDKRVIRPSRLSMILKDPSEAVQSADTLPLAGRIFKEVKVLGYRGALLHLVLEGISHHFVSEDPDVLSRLHFLFHIEDFLTQTGQIQDDFAACIYQKR